MPGVRVGELSTMVRGLYPRPLPLGDLVGIADLGSLLGQRAARLSGGQAQRVRFAAAIADDPLLLVLDEPTAAMDVPARRNVWRQIHGFAGRGRTVLFATHYLHEADDAADRVVVIAAGRKIADGPRPRSRHASATGRSASTSSKARRRCSPSWKASAPSNKTTRGPSSIPATPTPQCARWPAVGCGELLLDLNSSGRP